MFELRRLGQQFHYVGDKRSEPGQQTVFGYQTVFNGVMQQARLQDQHHDRIVQPCFQWLQDLFEQYLDRADRMHGQRIHAVFPAQRYKDLIDRQNGP